MLDPKSPLQAAAIFLGGIGVRNIDLKAGLLKNNRGFAPSRHAKLGADFNVAWHCYR